jgi:hypothetical protein
VLPFRHDDKGLCRHRVDGYLQVDGGAVAESAVQRRGATVAVKDHPNQRETNSAAGFTRAGPAAGQLLPDEVVFVAGDPRSVVGDLDDDGRGRNTSFPCTDLNAAMSTGCRSRGTVSISATWRRSSAAAGSGRPAYAVWSGGAVNGHAATLGDG